MQSPEKQGELHISTKNIETKKKTAINKLNKRTIDEMMSEKRRATAARIKAENANKIQTDEYIGSRQPLTKER